MIDYDKITSDLKRKIMGAILEKAMDAGNVGPEMLGRKVLTFAYLSTKKK